jgi:Putative peptidoglycan binding domain
MRSILILTCCLALAGVMRAEPQDDKQNKKKNAEKTQQQPPQQAQQPGTKGGKGKQHGVYNPNAAPGNAAQTKAQRHALKNQDHNLPAVQSNVGKVKAKQGHNLSAVQSNAVKIKAKHFELKNSPNPAIASEKFQEGRRIAGSEKWQGKQYAAFNTYRSQWHDRDWWRGHHNRIVLVFGSPYYWDAGFWYPAWGYDPSASYYPYDGPIYAYNDLPPDQVIANVQETLQAQGYYQGEVDGLLGPLTRAALADYQRDHGLYTTAAIDEPTLASLGLS